MSNKHQSSKFHKLREKHPKFVFLITENLPFVFKQINKQTKIRIQLLHVFNWQISMNNKDESDIIIFYFCQLSFIRTLNETMLLISEFYRMIIYIITTVNTKRIEIQSINIFWQFNSFANAHKQNDMSV